MSETIESTELSVLKAELENLRQEVSNLKAEQNMAIVPAGNEPTSRRRLLKQMGIAAAGLAAAGVASGALNAQSASANDGDPVIMGKSGANPNIANSPTEIRYNGTFGAGLLVQHATTSNPTAPVGLGQYAPIASVTDGSGEMYTGIYGETASNKGSAIYGNNRSNGTPSANFVAGVTGHGFKAAGVYGESDQSVGVQGVGPKTGMLGIATIKSKGFGWGDEGHGVFGMGAAAGVFGYSDDGPGVIAQSDGPVYGISAKAQLRLVASQYSLETGFQSNYGKTGDFCVDKNGILWFCVQGAQNVVTNASGTGGQNAIWRKLAGVKTAGQLHVMPTPERLIDTRANLMGDKDPKGQVVGFAPADKPADTNVYTYTIADRAGANGGKVPAGATAITGNVTVVADNNLPSGGFLSMWPAGGAVPTTSILNYKPGQIAYNNFTVGLSADGKLSLAAFRNVHVIIDVTGYYL